MSRNALMLSSNKAYLPGVNSILNSLDYYGNEDLDVHLLYDKDMADYPEKVKDKFIFNIIPYCLNDNPEVWDPSPTAGTNFKHAKYRYISLIKDDYDAVCHIGADCVILDNIIPMFELAAQTDFIFVPRNAHSSQLLEDLFVDDLDPEKADRFIRSSPIADFPCFYNPKHYARTMEYIGAHVVPKDNPTKVAHVEIYAFTKGLYDMGKIKRVFRIPASQWIGDEIVTRQAFTMRDRPGEIIRLYANKEQMKLFHNKFWKAGRIEHYYETGDRTLPKAQNMNHNIKVILKMLRLFNYGWKVNLNDVYDGPVGGYL